jgi:hypothetical protein
VTLWTGQVGYLSSSFRRLRFGRSSNLCNGCASQLAPAIHYQRLGEADRASFQIVGCRMYATQQRGSSGESG